MGVTWLVYCDIHHEGLNAGKIRALAGFTEALEKSPTRALEQLHMRLTQMSTKDPDAIPPALAERWYSIVKAFVERHARCSLGLTNSSGPGYARFHERTGKWVWFQECEDRSLWDLQDEHEKKHGLEHKYETGPLLAFRDRQLDLVEKIRNASRPTEFQTQD